MALYGLGGIGKTQTATQFVYRYKSQYNQIFWVNAATLPFIDGFRRIAAETACIPAEAIAKWSASELVDGVTSWLEKQWRWLLVIDNLDDVFTLEGDHPSQNRCRTTYSYYNAELDYLRYERSGFESHPARS